MDLSAKTTNVKLTDVTWLTLTLSVLLKVL